MSPKIALIFCLPLLFISAGFMFFPVMGHSQMLNELSDVQNGIFHLSPRSYQFSAETDKADQYIDEEQADFFISAAAPPTNHEADGNYPFSIVDHQIRDADLEIVLNADHACCPYPPVMYLSRENIFKKEYTSQLRPPGFFVDRNHIRKNLNDPHLGSEYQNRLSPPGFFTDSHFIEEPFHHQEVKAVYWKLTNYEVSRHEALRRSVTPGEDCIAGYMLGGYVRSNGCVTVWVGETYSYPFECSKSKTKKSEHTGKCQCDKD